MRIPIVFSTDHNFVMPTCVAILSLLKNSFPSTTFSLNILCSTNVTEEDKKIIERQINVFKEKSELNFIDIGNVFEKGYETRDISTACYSRLLIPWLLPEFDKIIYSDVDVVFKGDISEAYNIDLGNNLVGGVSDEAYNRGLIRKYLLGKGLKPVSYINSGFLVINSKLQREENIKDKYLELVKNKYVYQDQDIINIACNGRILPIPAKFNVKAKTAVEENKVTLIHYVGLKPWQYFTYCWDDWWSVAKESVVFNAVAYQQLCAGILGIMSNFRLLKKKITENIRFRIKLLFH